MTSFSHPASAPTLLKTLAFALVLLAAPTAATAQDSSASSEQPSQEQPAPAPVSPDTIVATVGGEAITEADLAFAAEDVGANLNQVPPDQLRAVLLAQMIDLKLMAQAGEAAGVQDDPLFQLRLDYLTDRALRRSYATEAVSNTITDEAIQAEYDRQIAAIPQEDEVHARHILVSTEEDARAVKAELDAGADFAELARTKSIEPNAAQSGGDLGYFKQAVMVKPFADAAFAMEVGQVSDPVQTQFGWHIIKVEDRRPAAKPTLEELGPQIGQQLYVQKYREVFDGLRQSTTIDIPDATLAEQVNQQLGPLPQ
ncbi:MAG TPA: peptidylprolyl isomerase [Devosia sp.]|nr:peptidylprolyl isomerase [Devosia sp.]